MTKPTHLTIKRLMTPIVTMMMAKVIHQKNGSKIKNRIEMMELIMRRKILILMHVHLPAGLMKKPKMKMDPGFQVDQLFLTMTKLKIRVMSLQMSHNLSLSHQLKIHNQMPYPLLILVMMKRKIKDQTPCHL